MVNEKQIIVVLFELKFVFYNMKILFQKEMFCDFEFLFWIISLFYVIDLEVIYYD